MDVIFDVATVATRRQHIPIFDRIVVTQCAGFSLVPTVQRKLGSGIVIKGPVLPGTGVVTLSTVRPQGLFVLVVLQVARHTGNLGVLKFCAGGMTLCTG